MQRRHMNSSSTYVTRSCWSRFNCIFRFFVVGRRKRVLFSMLFFRLIFFSFLFRLYFLKQKNVPTNAEKNEFRLFKVVTRYCTRCFPFFFSFVFFVLPLDGFFTLFFYSAWKQCSMHTFYGKKIGFLQLFVTRFTNLQMWFLNGFYSFFPFLLALLYFH